MLNISLRLKEERVRLGLNQADFATAGGVAKTTQFNYEKGERSPDSGYLAGIATVGADILYIVTGERTPKREDSLSLEETELVVCFRQLPESERPGATKVVTALAELARRYELESK